MNVLTSYRGREHQMNFHCVWVRWGYLTAIHVGFGDVTNRRKSNKAFDWTSRAIVAGRSTTMTSTTRSVYGVNINGLLQLSGACSAPSKARSSALAVDSTVHYGSTKSPTTTTRKKQEDLQHEYWKSPSTTVCFPKKFLTVSLVQAQSTRGWAGSQSHGGWARDRSSSNLQLKLTYTYKAVLASSLERKGWKGSQV